MRDLVLALVFAIVADVVGDLTTKISNWLIGRAAAHLPRRHRERWLQEWLGVLQSRPRLLRPLFALDLLRAAFFMRRDYLRIAFAKRGAPSMPGRFAYGLRRGSDIVISSLLLLAFAPLLICAAALIRINSEGPIFVWMRYEDQHGREFEAYRFRVWSNHHQMLQDPDGRAVPLIEISPVGRFLLRTSLDELPQLFNVLRGTMALVGPTRSMWRDYKDLLRVFVGFPRGD